MSDKKRLYIHGSFMNDNYGDFLLYYVINNICELYEDKYDFFSADVDSSYNKYCKINMKTKNEGIFKSDIAVFAGGGYFGEPDKRKLYWNFRCFAKHLLPAYIISKRNIPYAILGVETGPISLRINRFLLKRICDKATALSVRNEESKKFLQQIGVKNTILVNPDWIMGIDKENLIDHPNNSEEIIKDIDGKMKKIFVHLTTRNTKGMENVIKDLIEFSKLEKNVYFIIGCDQKRETQETRAKDLYSQLPNERCRLAYYEGPWTLSNLLNKVDAVITDKLHVGIVATKFGKEVISVASHNKSVKFYKLIGRQKWTNHLNNIKPEETLNKLKKLTFKNVEIDQEIFIKAKKNEELLKKFLENNIEDNINKKG